MRAAPSSLSALAQRSLPGLLQSLFAFVRCGSHHYRLLVPLGSVLLFLGCAGDPGDVEGVVVRDSAGVRVVELPARTDAEPEWVLGLDAEWTPGRDLEFGELIDVEVAPDGGSCYWTSSRPRSSCSRWTGAWRPSSAGREAARVAAGG